MKFIYRVLLKKGEKHQVLIGATGTGNIVKAYLKKGYTNQTAISKMCQDIILSKIEKASLINNVTIKGGVVLMEISNDKRRATEDLDIDFIKYSLRDESIISFINKLSDSEIRIFGIYSYKFV